MTKYKRIIIDGNDGTGKTTRVKCLQEVFNKYVGNVEILDRGPFSEATLNDNLFTPENLVWPNSETWDFINKIRDDEDTFYVIIDLPVADCQSRIVDRGDSIDAPFHNYTDLCVYRERFQQLYRYLHENKAENVIFIESTSFAADCIWIFWKTQEYYSIAEDEANPIRQEIINFAKENII